MASELVTLRQGGAEYAKAVDYFTKSLNGRVRVKRIVAVERVQNTAMWQSYAVKKRTIMAREEKAAGASAGNQFGTGAKELERVFERIWLFHGTDEGTVPKIVQQGFNRAFCGKNATMYGKGVYFARDAAYSAGRTYSRPNANGEQHIFLCQPNPRPQRRHACACTCGGTRNEPTRNAMRRESRGQRPDCALRRTLPPPRARCASGRVVVGAYCRGMRDALTPDVRYGHHHLLFDSTVDNVDNPSIYVTFHDAQACARLATPQHA